MPVSSKLIVVFFFFAYGLMLYSAFRGAEAEPSPVYMESEGDYILEDYAEDDIEDEVEEREERLIMIQGELEEMAVELIDIHTETGWVSR